MTQRILITGGAGFIGSHCASAFARDGWQVGVLDNFENTYSPAAKLSNVQDIEARIFVADIREAAAVDAVMAEGWDVVVHLAAKAGVRPSIEEPRSYVDTNITGTLNVLEAARCHHVGKLIFASSSSVYGGCTTTPFHESMPLRSTRSPYAATKLAGEQLCSNYAHLHGIACVALRFFTVYGPRQRPDLAIRKFATALLEGRPITIYGDGSSRRDYTFVSDIVSGIQAAAIFSGPTFSCFNLGSGRSTSLLELLALLEEITGRHATIEPSPPQPADPVATCADISAASEHLGYCPMRHLRDGLAHTVAWRPAASVDTPSRA